MREAPPEMQEQYNEVVARSLLFLYKPEVTERMLDMMRQGDEPQEAVGEASALLFARIDAAMRESGKEFAPEVKLAAAAEVMNNIGELATEAGVYDFAEDPKALEGAWYLALDRVRATEEAAGQIDPETAERDALEISRMVQDGTLDSMLGEVSQAQQAQQEPQPVRGLMPGGLG